MRCAFISLSLAVCASSFSQVYTFDKLNFISGVIATGNRFVGFSSFNDGVTPGPYLNSIRPDGSIAWGVPLKSVFKEASCQLAEAPQGGITLYGSDYKAKKVAVVRLNADAKPMWRHEFSTILPRQEQNQCMVDEQGNSLISHGPTPSVSRLDGLGNTTWTYQLEKDMTLQTMSFLPDRSILLLRPKTGGTATTIVQLNNKGKVLAKFANGIEGFPIAINGQKAFSQQWLKRTAVYRCVDMMTGKVLWSSTGPQVSPRYATVGQNGELTFAWSDIRSQYSLAQFNQNGDLSWVRKLDPQLRLDAIRASGPGRVQALTVPYNTGTLNAVLHTFGSGGVEIASVSAPVNSYSGYNVPILKMKDDTFVFSLFTEFNPGETRATGLIAKVWRLPK